MTQFGRFRLESDRVGAAAPDGALPLNRTRAALSGRGSPAPTIVLCRTYALTEIVKVCVRMSPAVRRPQFDRRGAETAPCVGVGSDVTIFFRDSNDKLRININVAAITTFKSSACISGNLTTVTQQ